MVHRGPDDEGIYTAPHVGLGQRRLSIIDLASSACAPLTNEDRTIWVVFNGEIYNFKQLRKELEAKGHRFLTNTDTEVIIHQYEEDGLDCVASFRGMFAFALWDARKKRLFCARDRLGEKPLCFTRTHNGFIFGSEIKAITADPSVSVEPNYYAIDRYLTYQNVPSPLTAFAGIYRLRPGEFLTCDVSGDVQTRSYWEPPKAEMTEADPEELQEEIICRLRESVRMRMVADVPLGAFLSGGIDSGLILALMAEESDRPVKSFSIGFEEDSHNELPWARLQAERYSTEHEELMVRPNAAEVLPRLVYHYNEPFADSSALPTYYVSEMTRRHVTVALSGDGGDESFAGYGIYAQMARWSRCDALPQWLRSGLSGVGCTVLDRFPQNNTAARLRRGLTVLAARNVKERFLQYRAILKPEEKRLAYSERFNAALKGCYDVHDDVAEYPYCEGENELQWQMRHDQNFYLPDCLMVKTDIASMANSLEVRCPFLDHEFMEFCATIPAHLKHDGQQGKLILKQAARNYLAPDLLAKPKTGFAIPIGAWFKHDLAPMLRGYLLDDRCKKRDLIRSNLLTKMVSEHLDGRRAWSNRLWAFLFLEMWFREFID
jgi:asparagine synthase (glutamine-hydrolysing)